MSTHLLVGNPAAQSGKNAERIERAVKWLASKAGGVRVRGDAPRGEDDRAVARTLDQGAYASVVAWGATAPSARSARGSSRARAREEVAMGMLPTGTANDQGRSFGLEAGEAALEGNLAVVVAAQGDAPRRRPPHAPGRGRSRPRCVRVLRLGGLGHQRARPARAQRGPRAGRDARPLSRRSTATSLVYAGALLRVFLESYVVDDKFTAEIEADGRPRSTLTGLTDLIVKGTRIYGGAWVFDRTSRHDDGYFEVVPFRGKRDWASKAIVDLDGNPLSEEVLNAVGIEHTQAVPRDEPRASTSRCRRGGAAHAAQIDGEEYPAGDHATIEVVPRAIRLVVP